MYIQYVNHQQQPQKRTLLIEKELYIYTRPVATDVEQGEPTGWPCLHTARTADSAVHSSPTAKSQEKEHLQWCDHLYHSRASNFTDIVRFIMLMKFEFHGKTHNQHTHYPHFFQGNGLGKLGKNLQEKVLLREWTHWPFINLREIHEICSIQNVYTT